jgi:uncharacterized protein (DUF1330 family)
MKQSAKSVLLLLTGFGLGAGAIQGLHAQGQRQPAYLVAEVEVTNPEGYQAYLRKAMPTGDAYHSRFLARGKPDVVEGTPSKGNVLIFEFPSMTDAKQWYTTPPYKDLIAERQKSANSRLYFVEGVPQ